MSRRDPPPLLASRYRLIIEPVHPDDVDDMESSRPQVRSRLQVLVDDLGWVTKEDVFDHIQTEQILKGIGLLGMFR